MARIGTGLPMGMTRREILAGLAASTVRAAAQLAPRKPRTMPMICLSSERLAKLDYTDLGPILRNLVVEGCNLSVRRGGHVEPEKAPADLFRAIEVIRGQGVDVPMISTDFTSANDPAARNVLGISAGMGVQYFRPGYWRYGAAGIESRLAEVRRDISGLALIGRSYGLAMGLHNRAGDYVGEAVWDTQAIIAGMDPAWVGYCFDPSQATAEGGVAGWQVALRLALPRLKTVAVADFYWAKDASGKWQATMCPMGDGMVDWPKFFSMLAEARFTGPISIEPGYQAKSDLEGINHDLDFVTKQVNAAYRRTAA
jgi:L-ribulose-5-phosphate 3-epimerase